MAALYFPLCCLSSSLMMFVLVDGRLRSDTRKPAAMRLHTLQEQLLVKLLWLCEYLGHSTICAALNNIPRIQQLTWRLHAVLPPVITSELSVSGCMAAVLLGCCAACLAGLVVSCSALGAAAAALMFVMLLGIYISRKEGKNRDAVIQQMPHVLRTLSSALASGKSLQQAIVYIASATAEPLASEFVQTSFELQSGRPLDQSVDALCQRVDAPGIALIGTALQISQRTGSPLSELFSRTARMLTESVHMRQELQVKTAQARMSARIVALVPLVLVCFLTLLSPEYRSGLGSASGKACLCLAFLLDMGALLWVRRLMVKSLQTV